MKKAAFLICAVIFTIMLAALNQGCNSSPTAAATATATPVPVSVTFSVVNNGGYTTDACAGDSTCVTGCVPTLGDPPCTHYNVTTTAVVDYIKLTRNSNASTFQQTCSIPYGTSASVTIVIPADDTYTVKVDAASDTYSNSWSSVTLTRGTTYIMNLTGGTTSTLDSAAGTGNF